MLPPPIHIQNSRATATIQPHGAHVTAFQPKGQRPVLFLSAHSRFEPGQPIRGGVPVIFPWFGSHPSDPGAPAHGLVRFHPWELQQHDDHSVIFTTRAANCRLTYRVEVGATLAMTLEVANPSAAPVCFEEALHTYLAVSDCRQCTVTGLEHAPYLSKIGETAGSEPIRFTRETDRLYLNTQATCILHDPGWHRRIVVEKTGSNATVVWNPWIAKAKALPDFGDDEWPFMVCIETVNARDNAVTLAPGQSHTMRQTVRVET
jgi:D-hexose-6-phosphate mutarotase